MEQTRHGVWHARHGTQHRQRMRNVLVSRLVDDHMLRFHSCVQLPWDGFMYLAYTRKTITGRLEAVTVMAETCERAITVCIDMMDAAPAIGAYARLCDARDGLIQLHVAAGTGRKNAGRVRDNV